jgi:hypothetical protein
MRRSTDGLLIWLTGQRTAVSDAIAAIGAGRPPPPGFAARHAAIIAALRGYLGVVEGAREGRMADARITALLTTALPDPRTFLYGSPDSPEDPGAA